MATFSPSISSQYMPNQTSFTSRLNSQQNSPADSAIGTASDSLQSPPLGATAQPTISALKSTSNSRQNGLKPSNFINSSTSGKSIHERTVSKKKSQKLPLPIHERVVCERDYERIVKETEVLVGSLGTSREQLLSESRLSSRECLLQKPSVDAVEESRKYYLFDPIRHEYRLYYSREVRLRSESNLAALGLDEDGVPAGKSQNGNSPAEAPLRRRHSAGAGRLRRAVPPPKNGLMQNGEEESATQFPTATNELQNSANLLTQQGNEQQQAQTSVRRGAFERNSTSRKPMHARSCSDPPPPRRRQWSGGAKRAAALKQQELEAQRRLAATNGTKPVPMPRNGTSSSMEMIAPVVTEQMLKELLRPLPKNQQQNLLHSPRPKATNSADEAIWIHQQDKQRLLGVENLPSESINLPKNNAGKKKRRIWDCFKPRNSKTVKGPKTLPESGRSSNKRLERLIGLLLGSLLVLAAAAAVAIVVIIWYI